MSGVARSADTNVQQDVALMSSALKCLVVGSIMVGCGMILPVTPIALALPGLVAFAACICKYVGGFIALMGLIACIRPETQETRSTFERDMADLAVQVERDRQEMELQMESAREAERRLDATLMRSGLPPIARR